MSNSRDSQPHQGSISRRDNNKQTIINMEVQLCIHLLIIKS